ncbi:MAG: hypothetical protein HZA72_01310 [Candidatus Omnitrophica bacterium]|nr:hypothetical protein [Candidatus Omnitrophota bacterium]
MKSFKNIVYIICFALIASLAFAAEDKAPSIRESINKKRIFIGDKIRYKVQISSSADLDLEFPKFKNDLIGDCSIKDSGKSAARSLFGGRTYINWFDITAYMVGKRTIPSIEIKYKEKGEGPLAWKALKTSEFTIKVESVLPAGKLYDIKDIKGPIYPFSFLSLFIAIIATILLLWLFFIFVIKKLMKKPPPKLPYEIALEKLAKAKTRLSLNDDIKEYYVEISDTVRRYIETVFSLRAPEMTTQEFLASLDSSRKLSGAYKDLLKNFMEACDFVKFAKNTPKRADIDLVYDTAKKFIEETKEAYVHI